ncbi:hypothetical protein [Treponema pectinovorum]|uniref:hypothetical protein n=1 Tax=Treponema pectinovorum TaxID=164 RepID=UPI0011CA4A83|nr:hypothetical protein [Treponema pectinovorum]
MQLQIRDSLNTVNKLISLVEQAEKQFKSARNWSFLDILGGGTITDLVKHYKLRKAGNIMNEVNYYLQQLSVQLGNINIPADYRMQIGSFLTFADFFFDGIFVDAYMTSKIMKSLEQIRNLLNKLHQAKDSLESMITDGN